MPLTSKEKGFAIAGVIGFGVISIFISIFIGLFMDRKKPSSQTNTPEEVVDEPNVEPDVEPDVEPEERLSENGNPFCKGYLVINGCNSKKYPANPQNSMDNPNLVNCDQRFISVSNTESSTGYLQCMLSKDGKACNAWNEVDKTDKVKCDLEDDGLPYCEADILHGPGLSGGVLLPAQKEIAQKNFDELKSKCRCEDGKSVKGDTMKLLIGNGTVPTHQWVCA